MKTILHLFRFSDSSILVAKKSKNDYADSFISGVGKKPDILISILDNNTVADDQVIEETVA